MKLNSVQCIVLILIGIVVGLFIIAMINTQIACDDNGGVMVRSLTWFECVKGVK